MKYSYKSKTRFTKHYFIGSQRVASKIGTGSFNNVYGVNGSYVTAGQQDYAARMQQIESQKEEYYRKLGIAPGVPTMKGSYGDPENTGVGYNTVITELGDHSVPEGWVQTPKKNTTTGSTAGAPISWNDPTNPEDATAGYGYIADDTTDVEDIYFFHSDHLGSTSYVTDKKGNVTQYDAYLPYGELLVDEHSSSGDMPYKFNGKEMDEETGLYYYGARYMNPVTSLWYGVDPLAEKYVATGGYVYTLDNPVKLVDPDGEHLEVYKNYNEKNGYSIVGGKVDNDLNVYENYGLPNQKIIGRMLTKYSFMDEKIETAVEGVQIELGDNFGQKFINKMERNTPSVIDCSLNAYGGQIYDFKNVGAPKHVPTKSVVRYQHRGMLVNVNGEEYIASTRDIGNYVAGYVAAKNG